MPLKLLAHQNITQRHADDAADIDYDFLQTIINVPNTPEYAGYNTKRCREEGHTPKSATQAIYTPLIDMTPSDSSTMMTAMVEAQKLTN